MKSGPAFLLLLVLPLHAFADDFQRGIDASRQKDYDLAITCFNACIRENPTAQAYVNRGNAYNCKNDYDRAIEDYSLAIRLDARYAYLGSSRMAWEKSSMALAYSFSHL